MATLTPAQFAQVADGITNLAAAIDDYLNVTSVPEPNYTKLNTLQTTLTNLGSRWEQRAAKTDYEDASAAFAQLSSATSAIEDTTKQLARQVADVSRIVGIVGGVADLAIALAGGTAAPILAAASRIITATHS